MDSLNFTGQLIKFKPIGMAVSDKNKENMNNI